MKYLLFTSFAFLLFSGCQESSKWEQSAEPMEFRIPPNFAGPVLVTGQGKDLVFDQLVIIACDLDKLGEVRQLDRNRFLAGKKTLVEKPFASLFLENTNLDEYGAWGKRYVELLPDSPAGQVAKKLDCGFDFAIYFVGYGEDAKHFFEDSLAVPNLLLSIEAK